MAITYSLRNSGGVTFEGLVSPGPLTLLGPFPFTFATNGLTAGVPIYTPSIGDVIYDIGISVPVAFDGTTPLADVGTFNGGNDGLFGTIGSAGVDLTAADSAVTSNAGLSSPANANWLSGAATNPTWELYVTAANPLLLVVSQTGAKGGAASGATAGSGNVFLLTASPAG